MPDLQELIDAMPSPGERGILDKLDADAMRAAIEDLVKGGPDVWKRLIDLLVDKRPAEDSKVRHALHALTHRVMAPGVEEAGQEARRKSFALVLAAAVGGDKPKEVQAFLIRQMQLSGGPECVPALERVLLDEELFEDAALALQAIARTWPAAIAPFRNALPKAKGKQRLTCVLALGMLNDVASLAALREAAGDADGQVRIAACRGLARLGDAGAVDLLIKASNAEGWERIKAVDACFVLAENLAAAGKASDAKKLYRHLRDTRKDDKEQYIRDAADRGLAAVGA
jgi:HEAT repeat protein